MIIRKAKASDIEAICTIYDKIHTEEEKGRAVIGWERGVYPEKETALAALKRDDLFVIEDNNVITGTGILNNIQVDVYDQGKWKYAADETEVMVMHTLVISPEMKAKGYGREFVRFYEDYAASNGCPYLRIDTNEKNIVARKFYKSLGYKEIGIVPCVFNGLKDVNLVLLEKKINVEPSQKNKKKETPKGDNKKNTTYKPSVFERIWEAKLPLIFGMIALVFVIAGFMAGKRDLSDMTVVSGNITVTKGAEDDEFGVITDAPVMMRVVEMNQYIKTSDSSYTTEYYDHRMPTVELGGYKYVNPGFPGITNPKFFYGEATIGDEELKISDELLSKFTFENYIYFDDSYRHEDCILPRYFEDPTGNNFVASDGMIQSNDSPYEVGHIRIRYYTGRPKEGKEYSIYGNIEGSTIGNDTISAIYDKAMGDGSLEMLNEEFSKSNTKVGIVALIVAVACFGIAFFKIKNA